MLNKIYVKHEYAEKKVLLVFKARNNFKTVLRIFNY